MPSQPQPTKAPADVESTTAPSAPCDRHPENEDDAIGYLTTLDEAGYKIAVAADSIINMKRFVCRVVDDMKCVVIDYNALMAYVPHHLGSVIHRSYSDLQTELATLCESADKWVVPLARPSI